MKVSIIMPVYNCEKYLKQALESIKQQTYKNWELIIVDDCSTDNSVKVINDYINEENNKQKIELIKLEKNSNVAIARNIALKKAQGRYIAFLDSDDIWEKQKLEKQIKFMQENEYCFTYTKYQYLRENIIKPVKKIPKKQNYKDALKNTIILTSTVMVDTNKIDKSLLEMPNVEREDTATWWKIFKSGYTAYGLDEVLTTYRRRKDSISHKKFTAVKGTWQVYRKNEKLSFIVALYYCIWYCFNATKRRIC